MIVFPNFPQTPQKKTTHLSSFQGLGTGSQSLPQTPQIPRNIGLSRSWGAPVAQFAGKSAKRTWMKEMDIDI